LTHAFIFGKLRDMNETAIQKIREYGQSELAKALCLNNPTQVSHWVTKVRPVPMEYVRPICSIVGITVADMRPADWHIHWPESAASPTLIIPRDSMGAEVTL
jgi:DNA-binding transcriptional regulator YdaS (Cro superfamily)